MQTAKKIRRISQNHPFLGAAFWILSIQYFWAQVIVAQRWPVPYGWKTHTISDLGNTDCALFGSRYVCSPLHTWMNLSFIVLGLTIVLGSALIYHEFNRTKHSLAGFTLMGLAGLGTALVGVFPENTHSLWHGFSAALPFLAGNLALVSLGFSLDIPKSFRYFTIGMGVFALAALAFFVNHAYWVFGLGGMERLVAYPQTLWLIIFGVYIGYQRAKDKHPRTGLNGS